MQVSEWVLKMRENVGSVMTRLSSSADRVSNQFTHLSGTTNKFSSSLQALPHGNFSRLNASAEHLNHTLGRTPMLLHHMRGALSELIPLAAGLVGGFSVAHIVGEGLSEVREKMKAQALIKAGLNSTGGASGRTLEQLEKQAEAMQRLTGFEDDQIMGAQHILLTFKKIKTEVYDQTVPAIADLAARFNIQLPQAAVMLGKALQDPLHGMIALRKIGISFTESQMNAAKQFAASGQLVKAQQMILTEVFQEVGGSAKAAFNADPVKQIAMAFKEVREIVGGAVFEVLQQYKSQSIDTVQGAGEWLRAHAKQFGEVFRTIASAAKTFGSAVAAVSGFLYRNIEAVTSAITGYVIFKAIMIGAGAATKLNAWYTGLSTAAIITNTLVTEGCAAAWTALKIAMASNPFGLIAIGVAALVAALIPLISHLGNVNHALDEFMAKQNQLARDEQASIFNSEVEKVKELIGHYKNLSLEKARAAAIQFEIESLRKVRNQIALSVPAGQRMTADQAKKYNNLMDAIGMLRSEKFFDALKGDRERLLGAGDGKDATSYGNPGKEITNGINSITDGGKSVKNVNITIQKLSDITVNAATLREGMLEIKQQFEEMFMRVIQGGEATLANE